MLNKRILFVFATALSLAACTSEPEPRKELNWSKDKSTALNKELAEQEKIDIQLYRERDPRSKYVQTGSGLSYWVYQGGEGEIAKPGQLAQVKFEISLLDGTSCYKTESDEMEEFKIDQSQVETGVQEGIKLLKKGGKAKLIIPSHLAHGLTGDRNKIPPLTPIVVDIHVLNLLR
jgi:FKBP-type peptidyl-prolyl cis-trans isomerase